jgi:hypothetical protein
MPPIRLIKIDIEGAEAALLLGARGLLRRDYPILVIEVWADKRAVVFPLLEELGYTLRHLGGRDYFATATRQR